jgi:hypothetical protein
VSFHKANRSAAVAAGAVALLTQLAESSDPSKHPTVLQEQAVRTLGYLLHP